MYANYPNLITQKFSIGTTIEGKQIWAVKISDNPNVNENEPAVGFDALTHAREPQSMMTLIYFMYYLLENYGTNPEVTYLVNNRGFIAYRFLILMDTNTIEAQILAEAECGERTAD